MRNQFVTPFWKNLHQSLPPHLQEQYANEMRAAERWELLIDSLVQPVSRAKAALVRSFQTLRSAH
jgi:hypothetical protein